MELSNPTNKITPDTPNAKGYCEFGPFAEERPGWAGYIEWERYPDKKAKAAKILATRHFPPVPNLLGGLELIM
jgi:sulfite oxidase